MVVFVVRLNFHIKQEAIMVDQFIGSRLLSIFFTRYFPQQFTFICSTAFWIELRIVETI